MITLAHGFLSSSLVFAAASMRSFGAAQESEPQSFVESCSANYRLAQQQGGGSFLRSNVSLEGMSDPSIVAASRRYVESLPQVLVDENWLRRYAETYVTPKHDWEFGLIWGNTFVHESATGVREVLYYPGEGYRSHWEWLAAEGAKASFFEHEGQRVTVRPWDPESEPFAQTLWDGLFLPDYLSFLNWALERKAAYTWDPAKKVLQLKWTVDPARPETRPMMMIPGLVSVTGGSYEILLRRSEIQGSPEREAFDLLVHVFDVHHNAVLQDVYLGAGGSLGYFLHQITHFYHGQNIPRQSALVIFTPLPVTAAPGLFEVPGYEGAAVWDIRHPSQGFEYRYQGVIPRVADLPEYVAGQQQGEGEEREGEE